MARLCGRDRKNGRVFPRSTLLIVYVRNQRSEIVVMHHADLPFEFDEQLPAIV